MDISRERVLLSEKAGAQKLGRPELWDYRRLTTQRVLDRNEHYGQQEQLP